MGALDGALVVLFEQEGADEAEDGVNESRQPSLSDELFIELDARREGVSSPANVGWGTETLLQAVSARPGIAFERFAPDVMKQVPLRTPHLNRIVMDQR